MADLAVTADSTTGAATGTAALAGETILSGQVVYLLGGNGAAFKATNASAILAAAAGIALNDAVVGQPVGILKTGTVTMTTTPALIKGEVYTLTPTGGGIAAIADHGTGEFLTILGWGGATVNTMILNIVASGIAKA